MNRSRDLISTVGSLPAVRAVTDFEPVGRMLATRAAAQGVRSPWRFAALELSGRGGERPYVLRESDLQVWLRHRTADVAVVTEIFHEHVYEPPPGPRAAIEALGRPPEVLDLGANIGLFGAYALGRWPGCGVTAYEPDPLNCALHRRTVAANPGRRWELRELAASNEDGAIAFGGGRFSASARLAPGEEEAGSATVAAADVLPVLREIDLAKIDIEGGEWAILGDARFPASAPAVIVLEYHAHLCPGPDPRAAAEEALDAAGMRTAHLGLAGATEGQGMLWAWRSTA